MSFFDRLFGQRKAPPLSTSIEWEPENYTITRNGDFIHVKESTYGGEILIHVSQCTLVSLTTYPTREKVSTTCVLHNHGESLVLNMSYANACAVINS